ncbi:MAG: hypothetical protein WBD90_07985 [Xanthobacteraceae bacterium]
MNQIIAAAVDDIDMRARLRTCRKLMQDRLHVDIDDRHAERLMIGRLDDGRDAQHRNAHGTPAPHTELNRRDINLSQRRRLRRFEKVDCARVLQLAVGDDTYRAVLAETVDPDQFAPVGEIDQAEDIVGRLGGKLGGETPGQAFPPRRLGDPTFRIGAAGKMRAHDAGNGRGFAKSGGVFARAADRRGKRRRQHPHMNLDALSGAGQHRRSDIAVRQQANRQRGQ